MRELEDMRLDLWVRSAGPSSLRLLRIPPNKISDIADAIEESQITWKSKCLRNVDIFRCLDDNYVRRLAHLFVIRNYGPSATVLRQGESASGLNVILHGDFSIVHTTKIVNRKNKFAEAQNTTFRFPWASSSRKIPTEDVLPAIGETSSRRRTLPTVGIEIAVVSSGELLGEHLLLGQEEDTSAVVKSSQGAEVLFLSREKVEMHLSTLADVQMVINTLVSKRNKCRQERLDMLLAALGADTLQTARKPTSIFMRSPFIARSITQFPETSPPSKNTDAENGEATSWLRRRANQQMSLSKAGMKMKANFTEVMNTISKANIEKAKRTAYAISLSPRSPKCHASMEHAIDTMPSAQRTISLAESGFLENKKETSIADRSIPQNSPRTKRIQTTSRRDTSPVRLRGENLRRQYGLEIPHESQIPSIDTEGVQGRSILVRKPLKISGHDEHKQAHCYCQQETRLNAIGDPRRRLQSHQNHNKQAGDKELPITRTIHLDIKPRCCFTERRPLKPSLWSQYVNTDECSTDSAHVEPSAKANILSSVSQNIS